MSEALSINEDTSNAETSSAAGFQSPSPDWDATIATRPAPAKTRRPPAEIRAGPLETANATGKPLEAVADNSISSVASRSPIGGKSIVWEPLATTRTPAAKPARLSSSIRAEIA